MGLVRQASILTEALQNQPLSILHMKGKQATHIYQMDQCNYLFLKTSSKVSWDSLDREVKKILPSLSEHIS